MWTRLPLAGIVLLVVVMPLAAVVELPGERAVKDALSIGGPRCGPVVDRGSPGTWRDEPPMPSLRDGPAGALAADGMHLIGGIKSFDDSGTFAQSLASHERFDFETGRYERLPALPVPLNHVGLEPWGGDIYAVGGLTDDLGGYVGSDRVWRYDVSERRWTPLPPMPTPRGSAGTAVIGDRLYVAGGIHGRRSRRTLEVLDLRSERWRKLPPMPTPRNHLAAVSHGGYLYALGGRQADERPMSVFERYDPRTRSWERMPPMPGKTAGFGFVTAGDRLIAAGGEDLPPRILSGQVLAFSPSSGSWERLQSMSEPKHGFAAAFHDGRMYAFGGSNCSGFKPTHTVHSLELSG